MYTRSNAFMYYLSSVVASIVISLVFTFGISLLAGCRYLNVVTGSMSPALPVGSLICVNTNVDLEDLKPGDIVTAGNTLKVTHRVVSVDLEGRTFTTHGDANGPSNETFKAEELYGRVIYHIPYFGKVKTFMQNPINVLCLVALIGVVVFGYKFV